MTKKTIQIVLSICLVIQILIMGFLLIGEIQGILNNIAYRFQYLLILYVVVPGLFVVGILEYFGLKKLMNGHSRITLSPFFIAVSLTAVILSEGNFNPITLSYSVILIEFLGIILFLYSLWKVIKLTNNKAEEKMIPKPKIQ